MNIAEQYKNKKVISFEIFPPKTPKGESSLWNEMKLLSSFNPGYISVTYGAGGTTRDKTLEIAQKIKSDFDITPLVHFTCVGANRSEIKDYIMDVQGKGFNNILALRGDPPAGETKFTPPENGFQYASELVEYINSLGSFTMAVAAYPEGHIEAPDIDTDIINLVKKVDAGADFIITQLFYNNDDFYSFMDRVVKKSISIPIVPGIMPVKNQSQINKITDMCGASIPAQLASTLDSCNSEEDMCNAGIEYTIKQCLELKEWGVPGFHFYALNKSDAVSRIIEALDI